MKIIVAGGGHTGVYIAKTLMKQGCTVSVLESRKNVFEKLQHDLPKEYIVNLSGSNPAALEAAGATSADALLAVTGEDEINIVASTTAKKQFHVPLVIARVINPRNAWMFTPDMGVDVAVSQADLIEALVLHGGSMNGILSLLGTGSDEMPVVNFRAEEGCAAEGRLVRDLSLPEQSLLTTIVRDGKRILPHGNTEIRGGDEITALADTDARKVLSELFAAGK